MQSSDFLFINFFYLIIYLFLESVVVSHQVDTTVKIDFKRKLSVFLFFLFLRCKSNQHEVFERKD